MLDKPDEAPDESRLADLLERYFAGEATANERAEVQRYLDAHPGVARFYRTLARQLDAGVGDASEVDPAAALARLHARLARDVSAGGPSRREAPRRRYAALGTLPTGSGARVGGIRRWVGLAAAAAVLVIAGLAGGRLLRSPGTVTHRDPLPAVWQREYATQRGQRATVRLADGSHVVLNAASRLRIPVGYGERTRVLYLEGQARFTVRHDEHRPFAVHTERALVEDLGTVFDVRAYDGSRETRVAVVEGVVALRSLGGATGGERSRDAGTRDAPATTLVAGQLATVSSSGATAVVPNARFDQLLAWSEGRLVFQQTPLADAIAELARWYDVDIRVADRELERLVVSASFGDEPVVDVLEVLSASLGARYERSGRTITLFRVRKPR